MRQAPVEKFNRFADLLRENGFRVAVSENHPYKWLYFEKNGKIGNVNYGYYSSFNFCSVHKPNIQAVTGFLITKANELTLHDAYRSLNRPEGGLNYQVERWKSLDEFIASSYAKWARYYILEPKEKSNAVN
jgi:hypothetical protein